MRAVSLYQDECRYSWCVCVCVSRRRDSARRSGFDAPSTAPTTALTTLPTNTPYMPPLSADPLETVRRMMGAPVGVTPGIATPGLAAPTSGMTAAQKKALLWGSKKAAAVTSVAAVGTSEAVCEGQQGLGVAVGQAVFGVNRWDAAEFSTEAEKAKFLKIMVSDTHTHTHACARTHTCTHGSRTHTHAPAKTHTHARACARTCCQMILRSRTRVERCVCVCVCVCVTTGCKGGGGAPCGPRT